MQISVKPWEFFVDAIQIDNKKLISTILDCRDRKKVNFKCDFNINLKKLYFYAEKYMPDSTEIVIYICSVNELKSDKSSSESKFSSESEVSKSSFSM